jgi:predicted DNA-binding transcriptional regulator YafY
MPATYAPATRIQMVRAILRSPGGATLRELMERLDVSKQTVYRYKYSLEEQGEPIEEGERNGEKTWRISGARPTENIKVTLSQMIALCLSRQTFGCFAGTGLHEDLEEHFADLLATIAKRDYDLAKNLDRKMFDVGEARHIYDDRLDDMNDAVTALIYEERLVCTHTSVDFGKTPFVLEPYTVLVYKKGLYFAGKSLHHDEVRTFALDGFTSVERQRGDKFVYPADYHPSDLVKGAWGLFRRDVSTRVRIRFDARVAKYVERRQWHATQTIEKDDAGVVFTVDVHGTTELVSWVLSFGPTAEVLEPAELREEVRKELVGALARYSN